MRITWPTGSIRDSRGTEKAAWPAAAAAEAASGLRTVLAAPATAALVHEQQDTHVAQSSNARRTVVPLNHHAHGGSCRAVRVASGGLRCEWPGRCLDSLALRCKRSHLLPAHSLATAGVGINGNPAAHAAAAGPAARITTPTPSASQTAATPISSGSSKAGSRQSPRALLLSLRGAADQQHVLMMVVMMAMLEEQQATDEMASCQKTPVVARPCVAGCCRHHQHHGVAIALQTCGICVNRSH